MILSDSVRKRVEENKRKAEEIRARKLKTTDSNSGNQSYISSYKNTTTLHPNSCANSPNKTFETTSSCTTVQSLLLTNHNSNTNKTSLYTQSKTNSDDSVSAQVVKQQGTQYVPLTVNSTSNAPPTLNKQQSAQYVPLTVNSTSNAPPTLNKQQGNQYVPLTVNSTSNAPPTLNKQQGNQYVPLTVNNNVNATLNNRNTVSGKSPTKKLIDKIKISFSLISRDRFVATCLYKSEVIEIFKTMKTRLYDASTKLWNFDLKDYTSLKKSLLDQLKDQIELDDLPKVVLSIFGDRISGKVMAHSTAIPSANLSKVDDKLVRTLHPFQREAINFGIHHNGRLLIADDMGLGKTLQASCLAAYYKTDWPLLVISPSSVRFNWRQQLLTWLPSLESCDINVAVKMLDINDTNSALITICSYDLMSRCHEHLLRRSYKVVIVDESHCLKNFKSSRTKNALPILKKAKRVILLSGTPALSRPMELFPQLSAICPTIFSNFKDYAARYCDAKENAWGWDYTGSSNLIELKIIMEERLLIRRLKKDVLTQLPAKYRTMLILDPGSVKLDREMKNSHISVQKTKCQERAALLEYFSLTGNAKIPAIQEYILDLLETDRKFIVFAHHKSVLNAIEETTQKTKQNYIRIDGHTNPEQRNHFCQKFQADPNVKLAMLSLTAANAGIDLSAASLVVFAELFWNPGILVQAEDRAHRIGQRDSVSIQYLVAKNTADDFLWTMIQDKMDLLSEAGLSSANFNETDALQLQSNEVSDQALITEFFEEISDDLLLDKSTLELMDEGATEAKRMKII